MSPRGDFSPSYSEQLDGVEDEDVGGLWMYTALEDVEVGGAEGVEAAASVDLQPTGDPLAEGVPGLGYALLQVGAAPVGGSLGDPVRGEEDGWRWSR